MAQMILHRDGEFFVFTLVANNGEPLIQPDTKYSCRRDRQTCIIAVARAFGATLEESAFPGEGKRRRVSAQLVIVDTPDYALPEDNSPDIVAEAIVFDEGGDVVENNDGQDEADIG